MSHIEIKKSIELIDYESAFEFMKYRVNSIKNNKQNELLWFLNHDHIYTQGTSAEPNEIINPNKIKLIKTNRGGKTTYHGPGQRIVYFIINLNNRKRDVRRFISIIEKSLIKFLSNYNIEARSFKDRVGIWVIKSKDIKFDKERKIGAIGLRVSKWVTYHGLSFNINPDLKYYNAIHSCGLKNFASTSINDLGSHLTFKEFDKKYLNYFEKNIKNF